MQTKRNTLECVRESHEASLYSLQGILFQLAFYCHIVFVLGTYFNKQGLKLSAILIHL